MAAREPSAISPGFGAFALSRWKCHLGKRFGRQRTSYERLLWCRVTLTLKFWPGSTPSLTTERPERGVEPPAEIR